MHGAWEVCTIHTGEMCRKGFSPPQKKEKFGAVFYENDTICCTFT